MKNLILSEPVVSFETANLAFERGFRDVVGLINGKSYYNHKGELNGDSTEELKEYLQLRKQFETDEDIEKHKTKFSIPAPTQSLLQKWLRDEHRIVLTISYGSLCRKYCYEIQTNYRLDAIDSEFHFTTYEEALEDGLKEALILIKY